MSSLFNKEDEDKLLPPEPCADQYVCVLRGSGMGLGIPFSHVLSSGLFVFLTTEDWGGPAPGCFCFSQQERGPISISGRLG